MNYPTIILGCACACFGLLTLGLRFMSPAIQARWLGKLATMRERFGQALGTLLHVVSYTVVPLAAGVTFILAGRQGVAVFGG